MDGIGIRQGHEADVDRVASVATKRIADPQVIGRVDQ
jgi:hypothetical protein